MTSIPKVGLLFDRTNDWLSSFLPRQILNRSDCSIEVFYQHHKITSFDVVFVLGYTKILSEEFIARNGLVLLVHESDLPDGKGFSPVQWQILEGKNRIKVSLIKMQLEVDGGDIVDQVHMTLNGSELYDEIREVQANATFDLIARFLDGYPEYQARPQIGQERFYRRRTPADGELDVDLTIRQQFHLMRIANNEEWPSFFKLAGETYVLKIYKKEVDE